MAEEPLTPDLTHSPAASSSDDGEVSLTRTNSVPNARQFKKGHHSSLSATRYSQVSFVRSVPLGLVAKPVPSISPSTTQWRKRTPSMEEMNRPLAKKSESLPFFPNGLQEDPKRDPLRLVGTVKDLPSNPKLWTPSQTAVYLAHVLRLSPAPIIRDLLQIVMSQGLTGRRFLRLRERDLRDMNINPAWSRLFAEAKEKLRIDCLKARILGEMDFGAEPSEEQLELFESARAKAASGKDTWKSSWRRSTGVKSKGRVKGIANLFEHSASISENGESEFGSPNHSRTRTYSTASAVSHPRSPRSPSARSASSISASEGFEADDVSESDAESVASVECDVDWSQAPPISAHVVDAIVEDVHSTISSADFKDCEDYQGSIRTAFVRSPKGSSKLPLPNFNEGLSVVDVEEADESGNTIKPTPNASLRDANHGSARSGKAPMLAVQDVFSAADTASEGLEDLVPMKCQGGSMVMVKKSQLAELEKRMAQMEGMIDQLNHEKAKQVAAPIVPEDDLSLKNLGSYLVLTFLGVGIVAAELLVSKVMKR